MAGFDEVLQLEQALSELNAEIPKAKSSLAAADKAIATAEDKVKKERHALTSSTANLTHMCQVADHVVLEEWVTLQEIRANAQDDLVEAQKGLAKAQDAKRRLVTAIERMEATRKVRLAQLAEFGRLIPFSYKRG